MNGRLVTAITEGVHADGGTQFCIGVLVHPSVEAHDVAGLAVKIRVPAFNGDQKYVVHLGKDAAARASAVGDQVAISE